MRTSRKIFNCSVCLVLNLWLVQAPSFGAEPQAQRSIIEKARMSTHVIVGKMESIKVIERASGKVVASAADVLDSMQCFEAIVLVDDIIANDDHHLVRVGSRVKIRFGSSRSDTLSNNKLRIGQTRIYWLSMDSEIAARDSFYFPFYGEANLCELPDRMEAAKAAVERVTTPLK
jgi:hypothetical protein